VKIYWNNNLPEVRGLQVFGLGLDIEVATFLRDKGIVVLSLDTSTLGCLRAYLKKDDARVVEQWLRDRGVEYANEGEQVPDNVHEQ